MKLKKRKLTRRIVSVALSATMLATSLGTASVAQESKGTTNFVKIDPTKASKFNDTNGDGLGEFEGFGTSLCWWANRIGYSEELTNKAGELFFNAEKGLGMSIGRYNLGGGDLVGEVKIPQVKANDKASMYDVEDNHAPSYHGNKMSISTVNFGEAKYKFSDADFGFLKGNAVGSFKYIGWINRLEDEVGDGDKLEYNVEASETGEYTVKILLTLTGTNERDVALRIFNKEDEEDYTDYVVSSGDINSNKIADNGNSKLYIATFENIKLEEGDNKVWVAGQKDWTLDFIKMAVIKSGDEGNVDDMVQDGEDIGELPEFFHAEHIIRSDAGVPGYCKDVTRIDTSEKSIEEYENEYDRVDTTSGFAWNYDWDADKNQINVLKAAIKNGGDEFITEIFSNSPPYFMTVSGCSSGNTDASVDNLRSDCYDAFAKYMADVIKHWVDNGIDVQSTTPMNEPYTNFWAAKSNKQEGCHFDKGDSQSKIYTKLRSELNERGLQDVILSASDETSIDTAIEAYNALSSDAKKVVDRIDTHSYSGSNRSGLSKLASSEGKNLWMSEVDGSITAGEDAGQMSAALGIGQQMITDVNGLKSSAWILWNAIDMHVDSSEYGKSWVDKGSGNDFLSKDDLYSSWIPNDDSGYWGFAAANHDTKEIYLTKKYYGFGQFSRYIRPGYTIIGSSSEGNVMSAYDPNEGKAVVVVLNTKAEDSTWKFDLSLFNEVEDDLEVQAIRTSGSLESGENWADVSKNDDIVINADDKSFLATVKGNSITTYIIDGVKYDPENPISDTMIELPISRSAISGSQPWSGGTGCDVDKLIDDNFDTFFDGVTNGYVIVDLGTPTKLEAIAFAPRSGYTDRAQGAMIAGSDDGEEWTKLYTITQRPSAGSLTYIYSSQFNGGNNNFRYIKYYVEGSGSNCNIAELKLFIKGSDAISFEDIQTTVGLGKIPSLPTRIEGKNASGDKYTFSVEWNINEDKFKSAKILDMFTVEGDVTGSSMKAKAQVLVVPSNLEYFVDCNNDSSEKFAIVKDNVESLLNSTPDQEKDKNNTWGALDKYGKYDDKSTSGSGWYAYQNQDIEYAFKLPAGVHELSLCGSGKWWNTSRNMQITYVVGGTEKEICTLKTLKGEEIVSSGKIYLDKDAEVIVKVKKASNERQDPVLSWICITKVAFTGTKGEQMYDVDGNRIQAHGGQIQKLGDTWYWIGEDKTQGYQPCPGIHMYTSKDLYNWKDEGLVLKTMTSYDQFDSDDYFKNLYGDLSDGEKKLIYSDLAQGDSESGYKTVIERPKMLYNDATKKYVIWFHADGKSPYDDSGNSNYAKAKAGIAIADNPTGPYTLLGSYLLASGTKDHGFDKEVGGHVRDMNLFKDDDGTAYVLYSSEGNAVMYIAKLNDTYTGLVKEPQKMELGKDFAITSTDSREAPAMFKYDNKYYLITSGCTGWDPNQARYAVADSPLGPWTNMGDPCVGDSSNLTFRTQSTCVIPVDEKNGKFIYMGDRWFKDELEDSRYVWLPIEFGSDNTIMIRDYTDWTLEDLENKASIKFVSEIPSKATSVSELLKTLPDELEFTTSGKSYTQKVKWSVSDSAKKLDDNFIGELTVYGELENLKREVSCKVLVIPENLVYFTDCYTNKDGNTSAMFNKIAKDSKYLINTVSDQQFAKDALRKNKWGYISTPNAEGANSKEDMGSKGNGDFYETGWWATSTGSIAYAYELSAGKYTVAAGFNEWWSATREMNVEVLSVDGKGAETSLGKIAFTLRNDKSLEKLVTDIEVPTGTNHIVVKVSKKSGGDPILSWIGIVAKDTPEVPVNDTPVNNTPSNNNEASSNDSSSSSSGQTSNTANSSTLNKVENNNTIVAADTDTATNTTSNTNNAVKSNTSKTWPATTQITGQKVEEESNEEVQATVTSEEKKEDAVNEEISNEETSTEESANVEKAEETNKKEINENETPLVSQPEKSSPIKPAVIVVLIGAISALAGFIALKLKKKPENGEE